MIAPALSWLPFCSPPTSHCFIERMHVTTDGPSRKTARRVARLTLRGTVAVLALGLATACSSSSSSSTAATPAASAPAAAASTTPPASAAAAPASSSAASASAPVISAAASAPASPAPSATGFPSQDVVSSIAADPKLKAELPAAIQSKGSIILGTTIAPGTSGLPHVGTAPDGSQVGVDVDLRNAIAKVLGVTWDVQNGTFATIIPGVQNGKYDVGQDNFGVTAAREKVVDFATYLTDGQSFLGGASSPISQVSTLTDICGLTVGTSPGSTFQQILTTSASKCSAAGKKPYSVQYFSDTGPIFLGLANGKLDVYFGPTLSVRYDAANISGTKFLGQVSVTKVGFVTAPKSPIAKALQDATNELIANGDYAKILGKWGVASSGITTSEINPAPAL
jgi:polar amino acid transport system substrate-binding protein